MRKAGVLMPVSALPSRIGAGELGESAFQFIELLKENHVKIWQVLRRKERSTVTFTPIT